MTYRSNGKLLLTAEYFVLDGALALALPVRLGQSLEVMPGHEAEGLHWQSLDETGTCWFEAVFDLKGLALRSTNDGGVAERLQKILQEARLRQPGFLQTRPTKAVCRLDFPRSWGLGTSSTLVHLVGQWARTDAFDLQFRTFGGSGYDIACADATGPICYKLQDGAPQTTACPFRPPFSECLYFVFLGQKQDSRQGIARYREQFGQRKPPVSLLGQISGLTEQFIHASSLADFDLLIVEHEALIAQTVDLPRAKSLFFNDFWGEVKSLGAWGGDFVLATSARPPEETRQYFNEKGCEVFFPYHQLVLHPDQ